MTHNSNATRLSPPVSTDADGELAIYSELIERLQRIERNLDQLVQQRMTKEWYTTSEIASILGKAEFTVREWCRLERVHARKRLCGRGNAHEWIVSHEELTRIQNHGLLPVPKYRFNG